MRATFPCKTGARTDITQRHASADIWEHAPGHTPGEDWKTTTFLTGLAVEELIAPFALDGLKARAAFNAYIKLAFVVELSSGDVVILDNQSHRDAARQTQELAVQGGVSRPRRSLANNRWRVGAFKAAACAGFSRRDGRGCSI